LVVGEVPLAGAVGVWEAAAPVPEPVLLAPAPPAVGMAAPDEKATVCGVAVPVGVPTICYKSEHLIRRQNKMNKETYH